MFPDSIAQSTPEMPIADLQSNMLLLNVLLPLPLPSSPDYTSTSPSTSLRKRKTSPE